MDEKMAALQRNQTWDLVPLPEGRKPVGCKWVFKRKMGSDGSIEKYKAHLVAKHMLMCQRRSGQNWITKLLNVFSSDTAMV